MTTRLLTALLCLIAAPSYAAISYVGVEDTSVPTATEDWTCDLPAGIADNDILVFAFVTNSAATFDNPGTGVTTLEDVSDAGTLDTNIVVAWKLAASEGASVSFTNAWNASENGVCATVAYRGVDTSTPIVASEPLDAGTVTAVSGPSTDTTGVDGARIIQFVGSDPNGAVSGTPDTSPTGNERYDLNTGNTAYIYIQDYAQTTGAALALDVTDLASDIYVAAQIALRPAAGTSGLLRRRRE